MIRVAIVEDLDDIRNALKMLIDSSEGFVCKHSFSDGKVALAELTSTAVDVVIMDINLPEVSGIECVKQLHSQMPQTRFMMFTVYDDDENVFQALKSGATGYILKRTTPDKILEAIAELHGGGSPMSSEIARKVVASFKKHDLGLSPEASLLTGREKEVLEYLAKGFLYKEIATKLFISKETVKKHIHNIYEKLQVQTRTEALNKAYSK